MSSKVNPDSRATIQDSEWVDAMEQYQEDRDTGYQEIGKLQSRVRELEIQLNQERVQRIQENKNSPYKQQLFQDRLQSEQLEKVQQQFQDLTCLVDQKLQRIQQLEKQHIEDMQAIQIARQEVRVLTHQVAQEREQVQRLSEQLQISMDRGDALTAQLQKMAQQIDQQQRLILRGQETQRRLLEQLKSSQQQDTSLEGIVRSAIEIVARPLNFLFPSLYK